MATRKKKSPAKKKKLKNHKILVFWVCAFIAFGGALFGLWYYSELHRSGDSVAQQIIIPAGAGRVEISAILNRNGIPHSRWVFMLEALRRGADWLPKAGEFSFPPQASLSQALDIIVKGDAVQHSFVVIPGLTSEEIANAMIADSRLEGELAPLPPEGRLLPETYFFIRGADRNDMMVRIMGAGEVAFAHLWAEREQDLPLKSLEEALILASIIEKETAYADERGLVASVFINRLRAGMRLQSDPTVIYGLVKAGKKPEKLLRSHLKHESPWNTYRHKGLPPTPISNPSLASLYAALHPEESPFFYFVADGKGGHAFAKTLSEHNRNLQAWKKYLKSQQQ